MAIYCVTYDLGERGEQNYARIAERLRAVGPACEVTASTWLVSAPDDGPVIEAVVGATGKCDCVVVFAVADPAHWSVMGGVESRSAPAAEWMEEHLPPA